MTFVLVYVKVVFSACSIGMDLVGFALLRGRGARRGMCGWGEAPPTGHAPGLLAAEEVVGGSGRDQHHRSPESGEAESAVQATPSKQTSRDLSSQYNGPSE